MESRAITEQTLKALRLIHSHGSVTAGWFAVEMGYGRPGVKFAMKGPTGSRVLKGLARRGLVHVWDDRIGSVYVTTARLTEEGERVVKLHIDDWTGE